MKKQDIFLLLTVFLLAAILAVSFFFIKGNDTVVIEVDGEILAKLPLDTDTEYLIKTEHGENLLTIQNRKVRITNATCPDKICMQMGVLTQTNVLTCLPNGVIVYLEAVS